ncbi:virulence RhuM family protein [Clostridium estertheticum]|nr:virulence RhuM family protein [Clostridium estertheticum]WLC86166.1 virulence RhuM family protein [Clostridium estertheticum]
MLSAYRLSEHAGRTKSNVHFLHIANSDKPVAFFSLDVIISIGYRVKSISGTQFRIWANERIKEYLIKGFSLNDDLLKEAGGGSYWKELLERIRDIRSSEKVFYRQILDIYGTSIDYTPKDANSLLFFQTVQNKMHYAAHGHTAAEVLMERANAENPFMGMTTFEGKKPKKADVTVAKNYLYEDEIKILNRVVTAYLEFAELQAIRHIPMYMSDWIKKLDDFIILSGSELLENAGKVSHLEATTKAMLEFEKYKDKIKNDISRTELDFLENMKKIQKELKKDGGQK